MDKNVTLWQSNQLSQRLEKFYMRPPLWLIPIILFVPLYLIILELFMPSMYTVILLPLSLVISIAISIVFLTDWKEIPIKMRCSESGTYYVTKYGKERFVPWDNIRAIKRIGKTQDYLLYLYKRKTFFLNGLPVGSGVATELQAYWHQYLKKKEHQNVGVLK